MRKDGGGSKMNLPNYLKNKIPQVKCLGGIACLLLFMQITGCAGTPFPPNTVFVAEVFSIARPNELREGIKSYQAQIGPADWLGEACGYNGSNFPQDSVVILRMFHYWHNQTSGMVRPGLFWAIADKVPAKQGNLVEMQLMPPASKNTCPRIIKVRSENLQSGQCKYRTNEKGGFASALDMLNPIGGSGSASLSCTGIEAEGWKPVPIGPYGAVAWSKSQAKN